MGSNRVNTKSKSIEAARNNKTWNYKKETKLQQLTQETKYKARKQNTKGKGKWTKLNTKDTRTTKQSMNREQKQEYDNITNKMKKKTEQINGS